jgi:hypothetical protein
VCNSGTEATTEVFQLVSEVRQVVYCVRSWMSVRREDKDGAERWSWEKANVGSIISVSGPHDSIKKLRALQKNESFTLMKI